MDSTLECVFVANGVAHADADRARALLAAAEAGTFRLDEDAEDASIDDPST
jgi:hypothetical protein